MSAATMFCKLKNGDRFTKPGIPNVFTKTAEREGWSPHGRIILFPDSMVIKKGASNVG